MFQWFENAWIQQLFLQTVDPTCYRYTSHSEWYQIIENNTIELNVDIEIVFVNRLLNYVKKGSISG